MMMHRQIIVIFLTMIITIMVVNISDTSIVLTRIRTSIITVSSHRDQPISPFDQNPASLTINRDNMVQKFPQIFHIVQNHW